MGNNNLYCTNCGKIYTKETIDFRCKACYEPLELQEVQNGRINEGNILGNILEQSVLERYSEFYPFININNYVSLGEGFTPL